MPKKPALTLSAACSLAGLSKIHADMGANAPQFPAIYSFRHSLPVFFLQLYYSLQAPLTFEITGKADVETLKPPHVAVCSVLAANAARWKHFTLPRPQMLIHVMSHQPTQFPALEVLRLPTTA